MLYVIWLCMILLFFQVVQVVLDGIHNILKVIVYVLAIIDCECPLIKTVDQFCTSNSLFANFSLHHSDKDVHYVCRNCKIAKSQWTKDIEPVSGVLPSLISRCFLRSLVDGIAFVSRREQKKAMHTYIHPQVHHQGCYCFHLSITAIEIGYL